MKCTANVNRLTVVVSLLFVALIDCNEKLVDMKIVDEPSSFGINYPYGQGSSHLDDNLVLRVQPANFSGPEHFKRLIGRCFESVISNYKYKLCPYSNITQHEQGVHWNPYKGVLGVWQEWEVQDNTYVAMLLKDGNDCGDVQRSVRMVFVCGNHSEIMNVTEPEKCSYHLKFMTPLVCAEHSMLVYPSLKPEHQHMWDVLEGQFEAGELTEKGYLKRLGKIFEKAGIYLSREDKNVLVKKATEEKIEKKISDGDFETLSQCKEEYKKLQEEVVLLRAQLATKEDIEKTDKNDTKTT